MTTLEFKDRLTEHPFSYSNDFYYFDESYRSSGLYFDRTSANYPYILKGGKSDTTELQYCFYTPQLRGRILTIKRIKEVMDSARIPLLFSIKAKWYLLGKGFMAHHSPDGENKILFIACVDGMKTISSIDQVKFYVSKDIYKDCYKSIQPAIKDLIANHTGDVIICNNILDYIGEKISLPLGVSLSSMNRYKEAVVRTSLVHAYFLKDAPLVVESNRGTVSIEAEEPGLLNIDPAIARQILESLSPSLSTFTSVSSTEVPAFVQAAIDSEPDSELPF